MKRQEILDRLGFRVPESKIKRVIVHTDIACEADDPFAIVHHLLSPTEDVVGIIAANYEYNYRSVEATMEEQIAAMEAACTTQAERDALEKRKAGFWQVRRHTMEKSYDLGKQILEKMDIDDVPLIRGAVDCIEDIKQLPESPGADFIIAEAMRESDRPLYIALQGGLTDMAIAYLKEPAIASHIAAAIWIGGGPYPDGGSNPADKGDFNMVQDITAAEILFQSDINLWQYPVNAYAAMNISLAEVVQKVRCKGEIGKFIADYMLQFNEEMGNYTGIGGFPHGELWAIGDNPTVLALLENPAGQRFHTIPAPHIGADMSYIPNPEGRQIRVYDSVDRRLAMDDLFAKLDLCYGKQV